MAVLSQVHIQYLLSSVTRNQVLCNFEAVLEKSQFSIIATNNELVFIRSLQTRKSHLRFIVFFVNHKLFHSGIYFVYRIVVYCNELLFVLKLTLFSSNEFQVSYLFPYIKLKFSNNLHVACIALIGFVFADQVVSNEFVIVFCKEKLVCVNYLFVIPNLCILEKLQFLVVSYLVDVDLVSQIYKGSVLSLSLYEIVNEFISKHLLFLCAVFFLIKIYFFLSVILEIHSLVILFGSYPLLGICVLPLVLVSLCVLFICLFFFLIVVLLHCFE